VPTLIKGKTEGTVARFRAMEAYRGLEAELHCFEEGMFSVTLENKLK